MVAPAYIHHSGWPWPLDGVQDFFEAVWDALTTVASEAARLVWAIVPEPLKNFIDFLADLTGELWKKFLDFLEDPVGSIKEGFDWILSGVTTLVGWWDPEQERFVGGFLGWLWDTLLSISTWIADVGSWIWDKISPVLGSVIDKLKAIGGEVAATLGGAITWISDTLWGWIDGALRWASDSFLWLKGEITDGLDWATRSIGKLFNDASHVIGGALTDLFTAPLEAFGGFFGAILNIVNVVDLGGIADSMGSISKALGFSPEAPNPEVTLESMIKYVDEVRGWAFSIDSQVRELILVGSIIEAASLGQMDVTYLQYLIAPKLAAFRGAAQKVWEMEFDTAIGIRTRQYFNAIHTPELPPVVDLIRFVVREVITPEKFNDIMPLLGFEHDWAFAYWEAHWVLPDPSVLYDSFHRGAINAEELNKFIVWHDYKPTPRPGISKSDVDIMRSTLKRLIPRVDLRYAWELGRLTDAELLERYEFLGYEDDAELMTDIQKARALVEEVHKLRDEWIRYHIEGFITEETLRANLAAIGIGPARIEYYATYATKRREREYFKDLLDIYEDGYIKDMLNDEELAERAKGLLVDEGAIHIYLEKAYVRKYHKPKAA